MVGKFAVRLDLLESELGRIETGAAESAFQGFEGDRCGGTEPAGVDGRPRGGGKGGLPGGIWWRRGLGFGWGELKRGAGLDVTAVTAENLLKTVTGGSGGGDHGGDEDARRGPESSDWFYWPLGWVAGDGNSASGNCTAGYTMPVSFLSAVGNAAMGAWMTSAAMVR